MHIFLIFCNAVYKHPTLQPRSSQKVSQNSEKLNELLKSEMFRMHTFLQELKQSFSLMTILALNIISHAGDCHVFVENISFFRDHYLERKKFSI